MSEEVNPVIEQGGEEETTVEPAASLVSVNFQNLLNKSIDFDAQFSRPENSNERQIKTGRIEILFSSIDAARDAYTSLQKMVIDGFRPEVLVDPRFFSVETTTQKRQFFEIADDSRLVFLLDAPRSIDEHMIEHFFNGEAPIHFQTLPMASENGLFQVEVLLSNGEAAEKVLGGESKFKMHDGENECIVTLLSPREYALYSKMDDIRPSVTSRKAPVQHQSSEIPSNTTGQLAPEIDEDIILNRLLEIIEERKLNFAEINEKEELYELCDTVSAEYNGVPDSILKPAMGTVLQRHLNRTEMHWMRDHIEGLLRMWKMEIMNEQIYERSTFVPMETVNYQPVIQEEQKETASKGTLKRQKAARAQMGVGAFLTANRDRLIVESGDVEIESDDDGNMVVGGEALSFEAWARLTKTKASGVVRANDDGSKKIGNGGLSKKQMRQARLVEGMSQEEWKKWRNEKSSARKADIKQRIMARGAVIEGEDSVDGGAEMMDSEATSSELPTTAMTTAPPVPPPVKELDEGEIDSDEEKKDSTKNKIKRRASSDSSDSSSTSSEEDPDGPVDARKRRNKKRKMDRKMPRRNNAGASAQLDPVFKQMFENRKAIIAQMSPAHKAAFASALTQIAQNNASSATQAKASQVINSMMSGFK
ncbi:CRE-SNA-2 protein [Caenorhabditis remanei]|uniref:CRE-SNA-2 protein n=1 Tax=Caenorhabditis remanei TaxID=31234 RepID=E3MRL5_CAERE|nr:CRE-SNA-2 protein [Caenorhabditis remanei]